MSSTTSLGEGLGLCDHFICLFVPACRKCSWRGWAVDRVLQTGGPQPSRSADQLQQERAAGPLPGIQKRQSKFPSIFHLCTILVFFSDHVNEYGALALNYRLNHALKAYVCCFLLPQECPSGAVDEETFKNIYSQFFPQGGSADPSPSTRVFNLC